MFEINVRPYNAKPETYGWYIVVCSNCGIAVEKTINFKAYDGSTFDEPLSSGCRCEICLNCLKEAIKCLESE